MVRLFIAVELSEAQKNALPQALLELKQAEADVKWVDVEKLHITLKFLGEVRKEDVGKLKGMIKNALAGKGSFKINMKGVGCFPNWDYMRVVWVGIDKGAEELAELAKALEDIGFGKKENRGFNAHVTFGRVKSTKGKELLAAKMKGFLEKEFGEAEVNEIKLKESVLTPKGPIYSDVATFKLTH